MSLDKFIERQLDFTEEEWERPLPVKMDLPCWVKVITALKEAREVIEGRAGCGHSMETMWLEKWDKEFAKPGEPMKHSCI